MGPGAVRVRGYLPRVVSRSVFAATLGQMWPSRSSDRICRDPNIADDLDAAPSFFESCHFLGVLDRLVGMDPVEPEYAAFVREHARSLFGTAYLLCGDAASAEDLVQDTLVATFERWRMIGGTTSPLGYVRRMLVNRFIDRTRGPRGRVTLVDAVPDRPTRGDIADDVMAKEAVRELLAALDERPRAAVVLKYLYDWPDDQIAAAIGCRPATVRSLTRRALLKLRASALSDPEATA